MPRGSRGYTLSDEQKTQIRRLIDDGVPLAWIADDVGVSLDRVKNFVRDPENDLGDLTRRNGAEFTSVWSSIYRNDEQLRLHTELKPARMNA